MTADFDKTWLPGDNSADIADGQLAMAADGQIGTCDGSLAAGVNDPQQMAIDGEGVGISPELFDYQQILELTDNLRNALQTMGDMDMACATLLGNYFEMLAEYPPREVLKMFGIDIAKECIAFALSGSTGISSLEKLRNVEKLDVLHSIVYYSPHVRNVQRDNETIKFLLHSKILKILTSACFALEKVVAGEHEKCDLENLRAKLNLLKQIVSKDIIAIFGPADEHEKEMIKVSVHDICSSVLTPLLGDVDRALDDSEPVLQKMGLRRLQNPNIFNTISHATHVYSELFSPSMPAPHNTQGLVKSVKKAVMRDFETCELADMVELSVEIDDETIKNGHSVIVNRTRFFEVIGNLARNAFDAKRPGEKCKIQIYFTSRDGHTVVTHRDDGVGIAPEAVDQVLVSEVSFTPAGCNNKRFGGLGVGLIGSSALLEDMEGFFLEIKARGSTPNYRGAEFTFCLKNDDHETAT